MIDIHTHILPGIDDGSRNLNDTLQMARIAADSGTTDLIATPHCNIPDRYRNYFDEAYQEVFLMAKDVIEEAGIPLRLYPGMEVYTTEDLPELFEEGKIMTLNGSHYLLMEFAFDGDPDFADRMLERMAALGVIPVVAHIERYLFVQEFPEMAEQWHQKGYVLQCNKGSFQGRFGRSAQALGYHLLDDRLADVIASDTHRPNIRRPDMQEVWRELSMDYPEDYIRQLFQTNPKRILMDRPAFYVCEGKIVCANQAARSRLIAEGTPVAPMLGTYLCDYREFSGGNLTLNLTLGASECRASVERIGTGVLFVLSPESEEDDMRALALAAQQLRLPLNQAMNAADELMPGLSSADSETTQYFSSMNHSLYQMLRIVLNMSDAYQHTSPRMELQDIPAVMHEVFSQCIPLCQAAGVTLQFQNLPQCVYSLADSTLLERAVYNLISNALKHVCPGSTIQASLTRRGARLYLTVSNPGTALSTPAAAGAFSRFLRKPGIEDSRNGLGLGMRLVQSAAIAHGGTVLMEPQKDGGMRVTMSISIRQNTDSLRSPRLRIDYAGERNHALIELSDLLPGKLYGPDRNLD